MDINDLMERLPFIIATVVFVILWQIFRSRRKPETRQREIAQNLLSEVKLNQALVEIFDQQEKPRRFMMTRWQMSKTKLDFLDRSLQGTLSDAFGMAEDYNQQLDMARKYRSAGSLASIDISRLEEALDKSKEGLEQWLLSQGGRGEPPVKYSGVLDRLFGGRN